jgi:arabinan endo-1,5-alpha-L-arabinosidase
MRPIAFPSSVLVAGLLASCGETSTLKSSAETVVSAPEPSAAPMPGPSADAPVPPAESSPMVPPAAPEAAPDPVMPEATASSVDPKPTAEPSSPPAPGGGGAGATGGTSATNAGGSSVTNGGRSTGAAGGTGGTIEGAGGNPNPPLEGDRCDIAVLDPNAPPQIVELSGDLGVHDPVVMEEDGTFYLFATGNQIAAKTSSDLRSWRGAEEVFQQVSRPSWIAERVPGVSNLWAPDISHFGGKYHLYYSASTFGENTSCIGHLTRDSLASGQWEAEDEPTICTNGTQDYNAIDPNVVLDTAGTPWLSFGSFWDGLRMFELDQEGNRVGDELHAIASRGGAGIEAPFIVRRCGYYYLFVSFDRCCQGTSSTYNIRVGRSEEVLGPYVDRAGDALLDGGGTLLVEGNGQLHGPGHNAVIFSGDKAYNVYHAYPNNGGQLRISEIAWDDEGWPVSAGP